MQKLNLLYKRLRAIPVLMLVFGASSVSAHSGHSHAQHDMLTGLLHALTTHPVLWAGLGIAFVVLIRALSE